MIQRTRPISGFTLLELLIAMSIMVVIASCLYSTLYTGFNSRRIGLVAVEPDSVALNVIELMKQDFIGTVSPAAKLGGSFVATDLRSGQDDTDGIVFCTTSVPANSNTALASSSTASFASRTNSTTAAVPVNTTKVVGGVVKVEFALVDNERQSNYRLVRRVTTNLLSPKTDLEPEEQVLCRSVKSLNFRFYDGNDWADTWDSTTDANSLPLAVEVDIAIAYDDSRAAGSASVLSYDEKVNVAFGQKAYKIRRLHEAFVIPCGGEAKTTTTTSSSSSSGGGGS
jgi:prepilin-type N-terminal cleavage/methylation domain-containing protein